MTQLTNLSPASSYPDLLTTTNNGLGLTPVLKNLQDGLGNNSPVQIATNAINFIRIGGNTFQLDGVPLTVSAATLNALPPATIVSGTLNPAQVIGMNAASIELIPAPGATSMIVINQFLLSLTYNTVAYTDGGNVYLQYSVNGAAAGNNYASDQIQEGLIQEAASSIGICSIFNIGSNVNPWLPSVNIINSPVCITNFTAPFANGDSNIKYYISYSIVDMA